MPIPLDPYVSDGLLSEARQVGRDRLRLARSRERTQPFGDPGDEKRAYVDGYSALAEALVGCWLNLPWHSEMVEDLSVKPPDVGARVEVRWTPHRAGHLIAHDTDRVDWILVLVRGELGGIECAGWTTGAFAHDDSHRNHPKARNPRDCWVPPNELLLADFLPQMRATL